MIFTLLRKQFAVAFLSISILTLTSPVNAQVCSSPGTTIYGLNSSGVIYPITLSNANVGSKINTATGSPNQANGLGYNNMNGLFYYFNANPGTSSQQFVSYDPVHNTYKTLASCPTTNTVHTGCVSFDGSGYYCIDVTGTLYYYSILLNIWTKITTTIKNQSGTNISSTVIAAGQTSGDIAIDGLGNLWIITSGSSNWGLFEIAAPLPILAGSVTAKQIIAPTTATPNGQAFEGIAFNSLGQLYLSTADDYLYELKGGTAASLTTIAKFNTSGVGNDLTSCSYPISVLPVSWVSFSASLNNKLVSLEWTIAQSVNSKGFYIQRSFDNKTWQTLGFVEDTTNNDVYESAYSFSDPNPAPGNNYYRIEQVDYNNSNNFSETKFVSVSSSEKLAIWPNPAKDIIYVQDNETDGNSKMQVYDLMGKMIAVNTLHAGTNSINVSNLATGTYIVHILRADGETENQKIIKH